MGEEKTKIEIFLGFLSSVSDGCADLNQKKTYHFELGVLKYDKALSTIHNTVVRHTRSLTLKSKRVLCLVVSLFFIPLGMGCVTQTERLGHRPLPLAKDESVWEEIQGVLSRDSSGEAFYTRTARGIKDTVAAWFDQEEDSADKDSGWDEARQQYEMRRQQAIRRVRQQNTLEGRIEIHQTERHRREP